MAVKDLKPKTMIKHTWKPFYLYFRKNEMHFFFKMTVMKDCKVFENNVEGWSMWKVGALL